MPCPSAKAQDVVTLKPTVALMGDTVRLSDVFDGLNAQQDEAIASAPAPGKSVTYNARILKALAEKYRLDWLPSSYTDQIVLTRAATRIDQGQIRKAVVKALKQRDMTGDIEVMFDNAALEVLLPADQTPDFALNNFDYDAVNKRFRAALVTKTGEKAGEKAVEIPVTGRVQVKREIPVLVRRLEAGTTVASNDIDWLEIDEDRISADMITDANQLIGRELLRDTSAGQPVRTREVIPARMVTRGSLVVMKIQTPYMLITAQGKALQDGVAGDVVRVKNTQSNRIVEGVVDAPGVIRIPTAQKIAIAQQTRQ